jgi:hypothetical protein
LAAVRTPHIIHRHIALLRFEPVLFLTLSLPILALGAYIWPSDDDFVYWNTARAFSLPFGLATDMYAHWSGRFVTNILNGFVFSRPDLLACWFSYRFSPFFYCRSNWSPV